jgi:hypothetical protein
VFLSRSVLIFCFVKIAVTSPVLHRFSLLNCGMHLALELYVFIQCSPAKDRSSNLAARFADAVMPEGYPKS